MSIFFSTGINRIRYPENVNTEGITRDALSPLLLLFLEGNTELVSLLVSGTAVSSAHSTQIVSLQPFVDHTRGTADPGVN